MIYAEDIMQLSCVEYINEPSLLKRILKKINKELSYTLFLQIRRKNDMKFYKRAHQYKNKKPQDNKTKEIKLEKQCQSWLMFVFIDQTKKSQSIGALFFNFSSYFQ